MGWVVARKCFVACLFFEESQQPTCPQVRHILKWTQRSFIFKHSSQPAALGLTSRIWLRCVQDGWDMMVRLSHISLRYSCTNWTAIAPSPTAEATRLTESDRTSPAASGTGTPGITKPTCSASSEPCYRFFALA